MARASDANDCGSSCATGRVSSAWSSGRCEKKQRIHSIQIAKRFPGGPHFAWRRKNFAIRLCVVPGIAQFRVRVEHSAQLFVVRARILCTIGSDIPAVIGTTFQVRLSLAVSVPRWNRCRSRISRSFLDRNAI
jgi:hypothetical protein